MLAANRSQKGVAEGSLTPVLFFTRARIYISNSTWSQDTPKPPHLGTPPDPPIPRPPPTSPTPHLLLYILQQRRRQRRGAAGKEGAQHNTSSSLLFFFLPMVCSMVWYHIHTITPSITSPSLETTRPKGVFFSSLYYMVCDMIWYGMIWYAMYPHTHTIIPTTPPPPLHT